jgi:mycothiol maleylpyruvate isomerase-like protein
MSTAHGRSGLTTVRDAYLEAASSAVSLLDQPGVAEAWLTPSVLAEFSVGGLAAHLGSQITAVAQRLAEPPPGAEPIALAEHYARAAWVGADLDADINVAIRGAGEAAAADGPAAVVARSASALADLRVSLPLAAADRLVSPPAGPWALHLDDFLVTRLMEIAVHSDDLAASLSQDPPPLSDDVLDPVFALLTMLARRRHGSTALLRALSRSERAPATISAF